MIEFNPYSPATYADPYPVYARMREEAPVYRNEELRFWALTRHADVLAAHNDWGTYSSTGGVTIEGTEKDFAMLIVKDPPSHRWHRKIISKVFTPRRIMELEPFIRERTRELLDAQRDRDEFDLVGDFSIKLPLDVISELLGIPAEHRSTVSDLSDRLAARGPDADPEDVALAGAGLLELYLQLVAERRANPRDDIISMIMSTEVTDDEDGGTRRMEDDEIAFRFLEMGFAGHETVAKGIPNGIMAMTRFPDQAALLRADPGLVTKAVEETLRFDPPSHLQGRQTTKDVTLHDVTIPAGDRVMLVTGSALRDERVYESPDVFDMRRAEHLSTLFFGFGIHRCLGAHLARVEIKVAFEEIFRRYADFQVDIDRAVRHVSTNVRGVAHLPFAGRAA
ncbi:cytochrome P450 [Frankia sp. CNm7]|uniref:Cytochrome P450 n=1 Tax=Frankia nepalensis TaxID=1836974 RepID=A0A937RJC9_9ACTN|nr:cytochrome P450 [Frankia nepalensis]MBL7496703.1 cytochrome P450 [Frankia nepalensis]MBL7511067.1 cytochrome P450 [Frankia nepalensis]MBL7516711.1 cytochrome P450 [Frankia nepalensis]MBL7627443.1 cytochrome P450 [Frankia nepalensis]